MWLFAFANDRVERCCLSLRSTSNLGPGTWGILTENPVFGSEQNGGISDTSRVFQIVELHDLKLWGNPVTMSFWRILAANGQEHLSRTKEVLIILKGPPYSSLEVSPSTTELLYCFIWIYSSNSRQAINFTANSPKILVRLTTFPLTTLRWRIGISHHQRLFAFWVNLWSSPQPSLGGWRGTRYSLPLVIWSVLCRGCTNDTRPRWSKWSRPGK